MAVLLRPATWESQSAEQTYLIEKVFADENYSIVAVGDSRVEYAIVPQVFRSKIQGASTLNFGFSGGSVNGLMLSKAKKKLTGDSSRKVMLVAISPHSLTKRSSENTSYNLIASKPAYEVFEYQYLGWLLALFDPIKPIDVWYEMLDIRRGSYYFFETGGWKYAEVYPKDSSALKGYPRAFANNPIDRTVIDELFSNVEELSRSNILVIGFRVPSIPEMWAIEDSITSFEQLNIPERFESAGGHWLDFPPSGYSSFDASHLTRESAIKFSQEVSDSVLFFMKSAALGSEQVVPTIP